METRWFIDDSTFNTLTLALLRCLLVLLGYFFYSVLVDPSKVMKALYVTTVWSFLSSSDSLLAAI